MILTGRLTGIIATTLGHDTFKYAMLGPTGNNAPLTGPLSYLLFCPLQNGDQSCN